MSAKKLLSYKRMQLKQTNTTLQQMVVENKTKLRDKFNDHIGRLKYLFSEYKKKQYEILKSNE